MDALPAPPDSLDHEVAFIRASACLPGELAAIGECIAAPVGCVGERHSHPDGAGWLPARTTGCGLAAPATVLARRQTSNPLGKQTSPGPGVFSRSTCRYFFNQGRPVSSDTGSLSS